MKDTSNNARIFVIGLDGGTFDLILPWVEKGERRWLWLQ